jgi:hypothetical protein
MSLAGIEPCPGLVECKFVGDGVREVTPLAALRALTSIDLSACTSVASYEPLAALPQLRRLWCNALALARLNNPLDAFFARPGRVWITNPKAPNYDFMMRLVGSDALHIMMP